MLDLLTLHQVLWLHSYHVSRFRIMTWYSAIMQVVVSVVMLAIGVYFGVRIPPLQWTLLFTIPTLLVSGIGVAGVARKNAAMLTLSGVWWCASGSDPAREPNHRYQGGDRLWTRDQCDRLADQVRQIRR